MTTSTPEEIVTALLEDFRGDTARALAYCEKIGGMQGPLTEDYKAAGSLLRRSAIRDAEKELRCEGHIESFGPVASPAVPATPICYGQVNQGSWCQEWYETSTGHAGLRARALRKLGYVCRSSSMGSQVTGVGVVKMTLLDIRPGTNRDTCELPKVRIERTNG